MNFRNLKMGVARAALGASLSAGLLSASAIAQETTPEDDAVSSEATKTLETVTVTSQKREQNLQDVPLSVAAVTGEELLSQNRNEIGDISRSVAGFTFKTGTSDADKAVQIRGVGTATFSRGVDQSVGTVIDGVVSSSVVAGLLDFSDVQRVEVLRGPQGMLFGKNASAGLLNIATNDPTDEFQIGGTASFADLNELNLSGYVSGPIAGDKLTGRLSGYSHTRDAMIENTNPAGPDYNDRNEWGIRGKLLFQPNDNLDIMLNYSHAERDHICCATPAQDYLDPALSAILPTGPENDQIFEANPSEGETKLDVLSAELNFDIGDHTLTSITSYTDVEIVGNFIGIGLPFTLVPLNRGDDAITQFTQEIRLASPEDQTVSYVIGAYYFEKDLDRTFTRFLDLRNANGIWLGLSNDAQVTNESAALFGQATWNVSDTFRLSAGLRYNNEDVSLGQQIGVPALPFPNPGMNPVFPEAAPGTITTSLSDDAFSWRLIGEFDVSDDILLFASAAQGYKGPGANTLTSGVTATKPIIDAEIPTNFEAGIKSQLFDGRMILNASIFTTEFEDFQASLANASIPPAFFLDNAGSLETSGLEVELSAQVTDNLFVSSSLASINAEFADYDGAACYPGQTVAQGCVNGSQDLSGGELPYSPDLTFNLFGRHDIPLNSLPFDAYVQGSYYWQDEVQYQTSNDPGTIGDAYSLVDLAIGVESKSGHLSGQLFVKNAFDDFYVANLTRGGAAFGVGRQHSLNYDYTRRVGVSVSVKY